MVKTGVDDNDNHCDKYHRDYHEHDDDHCDNYHGDYHDDNDDHLDVNDGR